MIEVFLVAAALVGGYLIGWCVGAESTRQDLEDWVDHYASREALIDPRNQGERTSLDELASRVIR